MYIHICISITSSKQALNYKGDGHKHLFTTRHSMNMFKTTKMIFFSFLLFSTDTEHFTSLFKEFKLNQVMQEIEHTLYLYVLLFC